MQNDKETFKEAFKRRLYTFTLKLIEFLEELQEISNILASSIMTLKGKR
jgi:hypothetical protein